MVKHQCSKCERLLPKSMFYSSKTNKRGVQSRCKDCNRKDKKKYYKENKEALQEYAKRNKDVERNRRLLNEFGITLDDYYRIINDQGGGCAMCGITEEEYGRSLSVDHNHVTGEVRGVLCNNCNLGLGMLKDNIDILRAGLKYLEDRGSYG